jgi:hypothetical protein
MLIFAFIAGHGGPSGAPEMLRWAEPLRLFDPKGESKAQIFYAMLALWPLPIGAGAIMLERHNREGTFRWPSMRAPPRKPMP